jgi:hypothetical protein
MCPAYMATDRTEKAPRAVPMAYIRETAVSSHTMFRLSYKALVRRLQEVPVIKKNAHRCVAETVVIDSYLTLVRST